MMVKGEKMFFFIINSAASVRRKPAVAQWKNKLDFDRAYFLIFRYDCMNSVFPFVQMNDWLNHKLSNF